MRRYALVIMIGVLIVLLALLLIPTGGTKTAPSEPSETEPEIFIEERDGLRIKGVFKGEKTEAHNQLRGERYLIEGMPCEVNEQETGEEGTDELDEQIGAGFRENPSLVVGADSATVTAETAQAVCGTGQVLEEATPVQSVVGQEVPTGIQQNNSPAGSGLEDFLRTCLESAGIGWWYPYAYAQVMQESHWNPYAENVNGLDKGLLQYRITFYPGANIFDPYEQIRIYVGQVANRLNAGLSVEETISRHMTSDWVTDINWQYVQDVLRWMN